jgi:hypothetical protein
MADTESQGYGANTEFPPGTVRLSDIKLKHVVLSPQPSSDPNSPLVSFL